MYPRVRSLLNSLCALYLILIIFLILVPYIRYIENDRLFVYKAKKDVALKYILFWTNRTNLPIVSTGERELTLPMTKCNFTNCFVTDYKDYFINKEDFDAIVFSVDDVVSLAQGQLLSNRSPNQKYIFSGFESADNFPVCDKHFDGYFNWTWTYKLDSDLQWSYFNIYDLNYNVIGPAIDMKWNDTLNPISDAFKSKLSKKTKAAAWFMSNCNTKVGREYFVEELQKGLRPFGWAVDIYGACGTLTCTIANRKSCIRMLQKNYHFYLSFENSFSDDYVTEKLLTALDGYSVPIVYGGANYSRYLPPGSYLDARELGPIKLARRMNEIIMDRNQYYDFFRWRNHYKYMGSYIPEEICKLCKMMNDVEKMSRVTVWNDFRTWWNGERGNKNC